MEDFDRPAHLSGADFRSVFGYPKDLSLDQGTEGTVYVEIPTSPDPTFVPFSYQSRKASRDLSESLLYGSEVS
jgi:hypothetical protein